MVTTAIVCGAWLAMVGAGCGNASPHAIATDEGALAAKGAASWVLQTGSIGDGCESRVSEDKQVRDVWPVQPLSAQPAIASRDLEAGSLIPGCQNLASVAAVCDCLTASDKGAGPSEYATCDVEQPGGTHGQVVSLEAVVDEDEELDPGHTLVLVAQMGGSWSALAVLDAAIDNDRNETPHMTEYAVVVDYQERTTESGIVLWVHTVSEENETSMGEWDVGGDASLTICTVPRDSSARPECKASITLANWMFAFDVGDRPDDAERCAVQTENTITATLESTGDLTLTLSSGVDEARLAGRYRAWK